MGPCSPVIAGVKGNVRVICVTGDRRIRITKYDGSVDADRGLKFASFVSANFGKIIHLDAYTNGFGKLYDKGLGGLRIQIAPLCHNTYCPNGTSVYFTDVYFKELVKKSTAYWAHGDWHFQGYYLV